MGTQKANIDNYESLDKCDIHKNKFLNVLTFLYLFDMFVTVIRKII